jgi:hypothetical protein
MPILSKEPVGSGDLLTYIVAQQQAGYANTQIKAALLANGYSEKDIQDAFARLGPTQESAHVHDDAQQYARQGMSAPQAFSQLIQQGHDPKDARKAVRDAFGAAPVEHERSHTVVFILIAIVIGAGGMYLLLGTGVGGDLGGVAPVGAQPISFSPSEIIAKSLEATRSSGKDAGIASCTQQLVGDDRERCLAAIAATTQDMQVCTQLSNAEIHDGCLLYFIDSSFDDVCAQVQLVRSKDTCESLRALRSAA